MALTHRLDGEEEKKKRGGTHGSDSNLKRKERPSFFFFETMHIKGMERAQQFTPLNF